MGQSAQEPTRHVCSPPECHLMLGHQIHAPRTAGKSPSARSGHRAVTDGINVYVFGGYYMDPDVGSMIFSEIWCLHLPSMTWKLIETTGDPPETVASSCLLLLGSHLAVFGGSGMSFGSSSSNDLHLCNLRTGKWQLVDAEGDLPEPAYGQSLALSPSRDKLFLFGGTCGIDFYNDVHVFSVSDYTWTKIDTTGTPPSPRYRQELVTDKDSFYIIGGGTGNQVFDVSDIYRFEFDAHRWTVYECLPDTVHGLPAPRKAHSCVSADGVVYMCGGLTAGAVAQNLSLNDIWRFRLPTFRDERPQWECLPFTLSHPGYFFSAVLTQSKCLAVFGGCINSQKRTNKAYCTWLETPRLQDIAWYSLRAHFPRIFELSRDEQYKLGIPLACLPRAK